MQVSWIRSRDLTVLSSGRTTIATDVRITVLPGTTRIRRSRSITYDPLFFNEYHVPQSVSHPHVADGEQFTRFTDEHHHSIIKDERKKRLHRHQMPPVSKERRLQRRNGANSNRLTELNGAAFGSFDGDVAQVTKLEKCHTGVFCSSSSNEVKKSSKGSIRKRTRRTFFERSPIEKARNEFHRKKRFKFFDKDNDYRNYNSASDNSFNSKKESKVDNDYYQIGPYSLAKRSKISANVSTVATNEKSSVSDSSKIRVIGLSNDENEAFLSQKGSEYLVQGPPRHLPGYLEAIWRPEDYTLQIKYTDPEDAGVYTCQVNTEPRIVQRITLRVVGQCLL